jgi:hypothetical protein
MARYSREAMKRSVAAGYAPPISCALCGQRFWTLGQRQAHDGGIFNGSRICLRVAFVEKPAVHCGYCQDVRSSLVACPECGS